MTGGRDDRTADDDAVAVQDASGGGGRGRGGVAGGTRRRPHGQRSKSVRHAAVRMR